MMTTTPQDDIETLNSFLRGELAAVETYRQCIEKMSDKPLVVAQLNRLKNSHDKRVTQLTLKIRQLGGTPETTSGAWGTFAKLVEGGATLFGASAALSALEEGEDHGMKKYDDLDGLSESTKTFVTHQLLPEQKITHDILNKIQQQV